MRRHKKKKKRRCERKPLVAGSEGVVEQQPGADTGLLVISTMAGGAVVGGGVAIGTQAEHATTLWAAPGQTTGALDT
jgi:hypothetical protein